MTRRIVVPLLSAAALLLALTACDPAGGPAPSTVPSDSPSSSSPTPSDDATDDGPVAVTSPPCTRDALTNEFAFTDGTAGQLHGTLTLTNIVDTPCSLNGYPTLYVGEPEAEGVMGANATQDPQDPGTPLDLAPGDSAVANVTLTQAGNVDGCTIVDTDYFVYAPPGAGPDLEGTGQHVYADGFQGCRNDDIALVMVGGFTAG